MSILRSSRHSLTHVTGPPSPAVIYHHPRPDKRPCASPSLQYPLQSHLPLPHESDPHAPCLSHQFFLLRPPPIVHNIVTINLPYCRPLRKSHHPRLHKPKHFMRNLYALQRTETLNSASSPHSTLLSNIPTVDYICQSNSPLPIHTCKVLLRAHTGRTNVLCTMFHELLTALVRLVGK